MSKTRCIHHIVFATKRREGTIYEEKKKLLYGYLYGIIKNKKCFLIRMNGAPDHIHILVDIHPTVALADLMKELKQASAKWIRENWVFDRFYGWGEGYFAVSVSPENVEAIKQYIINQEAHHLHNNFADEMEALTVSSGLAWHADDCN